MKEKSACNLRVNTSVLGAYGISVKDIKSNYFLFNLNPGAFVPLFALSSAQRATLAQDTQAAID